MNLKATRYTRAAFIILGIFVSCLILDMIALGNIHVPAGASRSLRNSQEKLSSMFKGLSKGEINLETDDSENITETGKREAYVTFLANSRGRVETESIGYFNSTRMLLFQLLHNPETRDLYGRPVVVFNLKPETKLHAAENQVMAQKNLEQWKKDQLAKEGAIIRDVEDVPLPEGFTSKFSSGFADTFTKFRAFEFLEYNRILFIDADAIPIHSLYEFFDHESAQPHPVLEQKMIEPVSEEEKKVEGDVRSEIKSYIFGAYHDAHMPEDYFVSSMFMFKPDKTMYERLTRLIPHDDLYSNKFGEQGLLNWVFRWNGPMPWRIMQDFRGENWPADSEDKVEKKGLWVLHHHYWTDGYRSHQGLLRDLVNKVWNQMEGYYSCYFDDSCRARAREIVT